MLNRVSATRIRIMSHGDIANRRRSFTARGPWIRPARVRGHRTRSDPTTAEPGGRATGRPTGDAEAGGAADAAGHDVQGGHDRIPAQAGAVRRVQVPPDNRGDDGVQLESEFPD